MADFDPDLILLKCRAVCMLGLILSSSNLNGVVIEFSSGMFFLHSLCVWISGSLNPGGSAVCYFSKQLGDKEIRSQLSICRLTCRNVLAE